MMSLIAALAPAIVKIIFVIFDAIGVKKEQKKKFLQAVINNAKENVAIKLREDYAALLKEFDDSQEDDVF